jgi:adenylyltransferase/sulfurtransferase
VPDFDLRYARQHVLPGFGAEGQARLRAASALIVGLGGLGSPAAIYLAAAGIGHLHVCDFDRVDETNLQRQILHGTPDIGEDKTASAKHALARLNPDVAITTINRRLDPVALARTVAAMDVVLDCSDNFGTRFAINQACVAHGVPLVSGAAIRYQGQLAVFTPGPGDNACYRCLFDESDEIIEDCRSNGILGPVTGVIGSLQAAEAIKLVTGVGTPAAGRLRTYDALTGAWREYRIPRDPDCPVCGGRR